MQELTEQNKSVLIKIPIMFLIGTVLGLVSFGAGMILILSGWSIFQNGFTPLYTLIFISVLVTFGLYYKKMEHWYLLAMTFVIASILVNVALYSLMFRLLVE